MHAKQQQAVIVQISKQAHNKKQHLSAADTISRTRVKALSALCVVFSHFWFLSFSRI